MWLNLLDCVFNTRIVSIIQIALLYGKDRGLEVLVISEIRDLLWDILIDHVDNV